MPVATALHPAEPSNRSILDMPQLLHNARYRFLPLPIVATDPAEGQTYGVLPVLIALDNDEAIVSVFAAASTYNTITRTGGFGNWLLTPSSDEELRLFGGAATHAYREASADYINRRWLCGHLNWAAHFLYIKDPFERFFGFGPRTEEDSGSNFTSALRRGSSTLSYEFIPHLAATGSVDYTRVTLLPHAITTLPDTLTTYGTLPEVVPSNQILYQAGLRWDSRDSEFFPTHGLHASIMGLFSHAAEGPAASFAGYNARMKFAWQPHPRWTTVGALRLQQLFGAYIPFYHQSSLGGESELRGFVTRRFTDRHAVSLALEERILVKEWSMMGTTVAFSIDPFFNMGQVFGHLSNLRPANLEPAGGLGFRMRANPTVLGRVDLAYSRDGVAVYTTLDYPF
ncbi:MAG: BamA/TamA family outer membrane protein [Deltaproteobacteria bacterium]|nr:BamA/TamA family outer membrane protein [Deltaproteobacteria bacterium]